jgi:hypothetical protein
MSNNPFLEQSGFGGSVQASFSRRFPDIDIPQSPPQPQYHQQQQQQYGSLAGSWQPQTPSSPYGQQPAYGQFNQQYPQQTGFPGYNNSSNSSGFGQTPSIQSPSGFQPSSSFGQQLSVQMTGMPAYGQQQQQQQYGGGGGYPGQPQMGGGYNPMAPTISEFDPYANAGDFLGGVGPASGGGGGANQPAPGHARSLSAGGAPGGYKHPREYVREHKSELETWDSYAWKQARLFSSPPRIARSDRTPRR